MVTIAHISDPHLGSPYFVPNLMNRVIVELNEMAPDAVVVSGDLTTEGYRPEYKAWLAYAERIEAPLYTVPGNHDSRNVGYVHFEDLIGPRMWSHELDGVRMVGAGAPGGLSDPFPIRVSTKEGGKKEKGEEGGDGFRRRARSGRDLKAIYGKLARGCILPTAVLALSSGAMLPPV